MRICAAWLLRARSRFSTSDAQQESHRIFTSGRCSLTPILRLLGRGFLARTRLLYFNHATLLTPLGAMQRNVLWRMRRNWSRTRLKLCSPWVIINIRCCVDYGLCQNHVRARQQDVTRQQRGAIGPRLSCPTRGTLG